MKEFVPTWLYIKQHNKTGLKYFGKTVQDPWKYIGSGLHWRRHLKKHGNDVSTIWAQLFISESELTSFALHFSVSNKIVESVEWANMKLENGLDGFIPGYIPSAETRKRMSEAASKPKSELWKLSASNRRKGRIANNKGSKHSDLSKIKMSLAASGENNSMFGKTHSIYSRQQIAAKMKGRSPPNKGTPMSDEQKQLLREKALGRAKKVCPHCSKEMDLANFARYHGERCKLR